MIYFDNAATTGKKPLQVINMVNKALLEYCANPGRSGHKLSENAAVAVYAVREKIAEMFGASGAEHVVFTANCTHSLNYVIKGVLKPEDHVIVSSLEHNAVMRPLVKSGVEFDAAKVSLTDDTVTLENFARLIKANTRMIICTGASNVLGKMLPIAQLGQLCKENGILFTVDAAQSAGITPIDMKKMHIDYLCIAPHKGLYAPMGVGILIAEQPIENTIIEGGTGTESVNWLQPSLMPEQLESGTVNLPGIMGISAGIDFIQKNGIDRIYNHEMMLIALLYQGLKKNDNIILYTPNPLQFGYAPVLSFNMKNVTSTELARILDKNGIAVRPGLHCAPSAHRQIGTVDTGTVRVCPSVFNTQGEVQILLNTLKSVKNV